ncbi:hypothetical protein [Flammeovirga sp. EKP202]|uniref:hypothetical protein n=1 Tax=Flammeovirga sp. EKP202 TaxID=2770592 RepID=UPI00165F3D5B|nr:hypothetical protein [Flammeovirga sp. EKP202]MBD0402339.1 hypothetical protein [Flammeovirga sp. EKP202]
MDINEVKDRVNIEQNREVIDTVQQQLLREKLFKVTISITIKTIAIFLLLIFFYLANTLQVDQFILDGVNKAYIDLEGNDKSRLITFSLEGVASDLKEGNYSSARKILKELPSSHHKDWFVLLTHLGLNDFDTSEEYLTKIYDQTDHVYHNELDYEFCLKYRVIHVKSFYDEEAKTYLGKIGYE